MAKRKKKDKKAILVVLALAAIVALAGGTFFFIEFKKESTEHMDLTAYFGAAQDEVVLINGGSGGKIAGKLFDGEAFLRSDLISTEIDPSYYYDAAERLLIRTSETEVKLTSLSEAMEASQFREEDGMLYLSLKDLQAGHETLRVIPGAPTRVVLPMHGTYFVTKLSEEAAIRYRAGIKSPIIADGIPGQPLVVLDTLADGSKTAQAVDGWRYVLTEDGIAGYVRSEKIGEMKTETKEKEVQSHRHLLKDGPVNLAFHHSDSEASNEALPTLLSTAKGLDVVSPTWFFLDSTDGTLKSNVSREYVETAHRAGIEVWALFNDFDGACCSAAETAAFLGRYQSRAKAISQMVEELTAAGADGINVDLEKVSKDAAPDFLQFLRELAVSCHRHRLVLSVDNYVPTFTKYMNRAEQARVADYIIVMCYDEHTKSSEKAGSVASLPFVANGIAETLKEVDARQLLVGIPFYTRVWKTTSDAPPDSTAISMWRAGEFVEEHGAVLSWDRECGQHYTEFQEDRTFYQVWMEDADSIEEKMKLVDEYHCAGTAAWSLGLETADIWDVLAAHLE